MAKFLGTLMALVGFPTLVYFGMVNEVEGAQYVVQFYVWCLVFPISLLAVHPVVQEHVAKMPGRGPVIMFFTHVVAWSCLLVMVWTGHLVTAGAWMFCMCCSTLARAGAEKIRAGTAENR